MAQCLQFSSCRALFSMAITTTMSHRWFCNAIHKSIKWIEADSLSCCGKIFMRNRWICEKECKCCALRDERYSFADWDLARKNGKFDKNLSWKNFASIFKFFFCKVKVKLKWKLKFKIFNRNWALTYLFFFIIKI